MSMPDVQIYPDAGQLARAAAEAVVRLAADCVALRGVFSVAIPGGSTPQAAFRLLASDAYREQVDWENVHVFWGDERCVPPDHPDSNYRKAHEALLGKVPLLEANIHRIQAELRPDLAAQEYEKELLTYFPSLASDESRMRAGFDLALLGMGDDGHTASLFPGTSAVNEKVSWTAAQYIDKLGAWRVTLTPALLNRSAHILFLVSGLSKSQVLQKVLYGSYQPDRYPAQIIQPVDGSLTWLVDEEAAALF